jgi:hypothetical protein
MKAILLCIAIVWGLVSLTEPALASCTTNTVFLPDGRAVICTSCCVSGNCTTTCV